MARSVSHGLILGRDIKDWGIERDLWANGKTGQSQFLTAPMLAKPLQFSSLSLDTDKYDAEQGKRKGDSDSRLMEMLAAQAAHRDGSDVEDEEAVRFRSYGD